MKKNETNLFSGLYLGEYDHTLDAQSRVSFPSEWRNREGETELVLIPARGKALILLPLATFLDFVNKAKSQAIANPAMQMAFAFLGANSRQCHCDRQGRIALDRKMLDRIGVSGCLKLIGAVTHIRLCAPENWQNPSDEGAMETYLDEIRKIGDASPDLQALLHGMIGK